MTHFFVNKHALKTIALIPIKSALMLFPPVGIPIIAGFHAYSAFSYGKLIANLVHLFYSQDTIRNICTSNGHNGVIIPLGQMFWLPSSIDMRNIRPQEVYQTKNLPEIVTRTLPVGTLGLPYVGFLWTRDESDIVWSIKSGNLPKGLYLDGEKGIIYVDISAYRLQFQTYH